MGGMWRRAVPTALEVCCGGMVWWSDGLIAEARAFFKGDQGVLHRSVEEGT